MNADMKPFEEMDRDELIAAAKFWQSEYWRVVCDPAQTDRRSLAQMVERELCRMVRTRPSTRY